MKTAVIVNQNLPVIHLQIAISGIHEYYKAALSFLSPNARNIYRQWCDRDGVMCNTLCAVAFRYYMASNTVTNIFG